MTRSEHEITIGFLTLVNQSTTTRELIEASAEFFRTMSGCEAAGIRVRDGEDYPYYEAQGFPDDFVCLENSLCTPLPNGDVLRDDAGNPVLECMCGNVIGGRFDPAHPFFTPGGSFWTNSTSQLLAATMASERQGRTRNRCNARGYESVALIPIALGSERLGLLQLNDRRRDQFSAEFILLWERLTGYLAVALGKSRAEDALRESEERYRSLFENNHAVMLLIAPEDGAIIDANPAAASFYGWSRAELQRKKISELNTLPPSEIQLRMEHARREGRGSFIFSHRRADGGVRDVEVFSGPIHLKGRPLLFSIVQDITERRCREETLQARLRLSEFAYRHSLDELLREMLDEAERLTGSRIGFFRLVAEDQKTLRLQMWSTNTLQGICTVAADVSQMYYDIEQAGVWVDCIRQRRPVIHNDYAALPHRKGLPPGHVPIVRELLVPVIRGQRVVAVLGVGNKPENYGPEDIETVSLLADLAWDISERKRSEEALHALLHRTRTSEERMAIILASVTDGLVALDGEGRVTLMNPAAQRLLGTRNGEGIGRTATEVIRDPELLSCCLRFLAGETPVASNEFSIFDDSRQESRIIQAHLAALPESGSDRGGLIAALFDVTRDREIERLKSEFVTTAAHELRTPLTAILGYAELLESDEDSRHFTPEERHEFIGQIIEKGETLSQIINDFLDLDRIEGGRPLLLEKAPCDMARVIEGAVDHFRREASGHRFETRVESPTEVVADRGKISQVLDNLLTNAIKYSPHGGTILVEGRAEAGEFHLSVADQGIGMTTEQAQRIFEKFYRADTSTTAVGGLGLGMCVAKGIVDAHGGRIRVESAPGCGTTINLTLPLTDPLRD